MSFRNYRHCAACGAPILVSYSRYCVKHMHLQLRYGSPRGSRLSVAEMKPYEDMIGRALAARYESKPVQAAFELCKGILNYRPSHGRSVQLSIQRQMQRLLDGGVTPHEFLLTVCAVFAMEWLEEGRFTSSKEVNYQVARQVLKLRSMHRWKPNATFLSHLGSLLREELGMFAYSLTREAMKADTKKEQLRNDIRNGWHEPATNP